MMTTNDSLRSLQWDGEALTLLDQTKLPGERVYIRCIDWRVVAEAIKMLRVRGAPAIGVAAAYAMILAAREAQKSGADEEERRLLLANFAYDLANTRPTAVNLAWAVKRLEAVAAEEVSFDTVPAALEAEAKAVEAEDLGLNKAMAEAGLTLFEGKKGVRILTHCNAGALATAGIGTALGVIRSLHQKGCIHMVYADETRPLLQGARLTAFELMADGVDTTLICDNMASQVMKNGWVQAVFVGCDRVAANGDVCNKIGTSGVAVLAKYYGIPFYVCGPTTTIDMQTARGEDIPIEQRPEEEVTERWYQKRMAPEGVHVYNPAFDVTPNELVTAIVTECGIARPPYTESLKRIETLRANLSHPQRG